MTDKHAANKALYAIDAEHNLRPFLFWWVRVNEMWEGCSIEPSWSENSEYLRKDDAPDYSALKKMDEEQVERYTIKNSIEQTLEERGNRYGDFKEHARITQSLKECMIDSPNWADMRCDQKEALEMVQHKIGRILNGDPDYHDNWHDCVGYLKLIADTLWPL